MIIMNNRRYINIVLLLVLVITGTVVSMQEQPPVQHSFVTTLLQKIKNGYSVVNQNWNYFCEEILAPALSGYMLSDDPVNVESELQPELPRQLLAPVPGDNVPAVPSASGLPDSSLPNRGPKNGDVKNENPLPNSGTSSDSDKTSQSDFKNTNQDNKTGELPKTPVVLKKPLLVFSTVGGASLGAGAALVYKAISYLRLSVIERNLKSLDVLICAADSCDEATLKEIFAQEEKLLTLLVCSEKGLLLYLIPKKEEFKEAVTKLKQEIPARAKDSLLARIGYGIKADVVRAQGCWGRARTAIKEKLSKVFK